MKNTIISVIAVILVALVLYGGYALTHPAKSNNVVSGGPSSVNGVQSAQQMTLSNSTTTLASFYNYDGTDRVISGITLWTPQNNTTQTVSVATSTNGVSLVGNTIAKFGFSTSSVPAYYATTTQMQYSGLASNLATSTGAQNLIWPAGTYLNFITSVMPDASTTIPIGTGGANWNWSTTTKAFNGFASVQYFNQ